MACSSYPRPLVRTLALTHRSVKLDSDWLSPWDTDLWLVDVQEVMVKLLQEGALNSSVGLDCDSGEACVPQDKGIYDNYRWYSSLIGQITTILISDWLISSSESRDRWSTAAQSSPPTCCWWTRSCAREWAVSRDKYSVFQYSCHVQGVSISLSCQSQWITTKHPSLDQ